MNICLYMVANSSDFLALKNVIVIFALFNRQIMAIRVGKIYLKIFPGKKSDVAGSCGLYTLNIYIAKSFLIAL